MLQVDDHLISPQPLPGPHAGPELAMIMEAITGAQRAPETVVHTTGAPYYRGGRHYAVFESLAYTLTCTVSRDDEGFTWETVPARPWGSLVGCWPEWDVGRILHLVRFRFIEGEYVFHPRWEPVWLACAWHPLDAVGLGALQAAINPLPAAA